MARREDPKVAEVRALARQAFGEEARDLPEEKRSELRKQFFEANRDLTDDQRRQLIDDRRKEFDKRLDEYFKLSPEERKDFLNAEIDRMQERMKRFAGLSKEQRERMRPPGGRGRDGDGRSGGDGATKGGGGPRPPMSQQQRNEFARKMLDSTTPERRAQMAEFFTQMRAAMQARGITPPGPPGGGPGPGFGPPIFGPPPGPPPR
jgi:hypothetical protein